MTGALLGRLRANNPALSIEGILFLDLVAVVGATPQWFLVNVLMGIPP